MKRPMKEILSTTFESACIWIQKLLKLSFTLTIYRRKTKYFASNVQPIEYLVHVFIL